MTIRRPSTREELLAWHARSLADRRTPRQDEWPECGYYRVKLVKGGPWVALLISVRQPKCPETGELIAPETIYARLNGVEIEDTPKQPAQERICALWRFAQAITPEVFKALREPADVTTRVDLTRALPEAPRKHPHA